MQGRNVRPVSFSRRPISLSIALHDLERLYRLYQLVEFYDPESWKRVEKESESCSRCCQLDAPLVSAVPRMEADSFKHTEHTAASFSQLAYSDSTCLI